jgi:AraC-like DNA-binding protein
MKPALERINPKFGTSIFVNQHFEQIVKFQASWHFHPEVELVYVHKGEGKVHIGNHLSYFNNSQLLMIGANLPHNGFSDRLTIKGSETIVQFRPEFVGDAFLKLPEMKSIIALFDRAQRGIQFKHETKKLVGPKIQNLMQREGFSRVLLLLEILNDLSLVSDYTLLNVEGFSFETTRQDSNKIDVIYKHIKNNFDRPISLEEIAGKASMTVPAFCRYFKKSTGKTFTKMVNEIRIVHATKLLSESTSSIADISYECGFNNFSHFNKLFKEFTGKSALKYRGEMRRLVQ